MIERDQLAKDILLEVIKSQSMADFSHADRSKYAVISADSLISALRVNGAVHVKHYLEQAEGK